MTIDPLKHDGLMFVERMPRGHVQEILIHLEGKPRFNGHVKRHGAPVTSTSDSSCWSMEDVVLAPHLLEFALGLTDLVEAYLRQLPLMYSVNAFTTFPFTGPMNPDIQEFHRDKDDVRFLALFVYLTDVMSEEQGGHQFQIGTHEGAAPGPIHTILGLAGTAFLADTRGLHMGIRPSDGSRTLAWVRWGVSKVPASYQWDGLSHVPKEKLSTRYPTDQRLRDSLWLVAH